MTILIDDIHLKGLCLESLIKTVEESTNEKVVLVSGLAKGEMMNPGLTGFNGMVRGYQCDFAVFDEIDAVLGLEEAADDFQIALQQANDRAVGEGRAFSQLYGTGYGNGVTVVDPIQEQNKTKEGFNSFLQSKQKRRR